MNQHNTRRSLFRFRVGSPDGPRGSAKFKPGEHGLKRELSLRDLVLMQVILSFNLAWVGFAAKQGSTHVVLWLLAMILFYLPLVTVVMKLSRAIPVEGGVYQWVRRGISPFAGYMAAWSLFVYAIASFASAGPVLASGIAYSAGPDASWLAGSKSFTVIVGVVACLIGYGVNVRGMRILKWLGGTGSLLWVLLFAMMVYLYVMAWAKGLPRVHDSVSLSWPGFSILTINVLTKMSLGALSGFDTSAVFSEECQRPESDIARSVSIAAPLMAVMYILGTGTVLAYMPPAQVDLAATIPQVMHAGFGGTALGRVLVMIAGNIFNFTYLVSLVISIGMIARLPMVAGWDGLLPGWWSDLHPRFGTPTKAIGAVTLSILLFVVLNSLGAGTQEAVQICVSVNGAALCIMYMLLFSVILFGSGRGLTRAGVGTRLGALCAFTICVIALIFDAIPLGEVASPALFALKVAATICVAYSLGAFLYWRGVRRINMSSTVCASIDRMESAR